MFQMNQDDLHRWERREMSNLVDTFLDSFWFLKKKLIATKEELNLLIANKIKFYELLEKINEGMERERQTLEIKIQQNTERRDELGERLKAMMKGYSLLRENIVDMMAQVDTETLKLQTEIDTAFKRLTAVDKMLRNFLMPPNK